MACYWKNLANYNILYEFYLKKNLNRIENRKKLQESSELGKNRNCHITRLNINFSRLKSFWLGRTLTISLVIDKNIYIYIYMNLSVALNNFQQLFSYVTDHFLKYHGYRK